MKRLAIFLFALTPAAWAIAPEDVLPPEEVFRFEAQIRDETLVIDWQITPEHYLYQQRFGFASLTDGITLGPPEYPAGITHTDEFFGESIIYREQARIRIPIVGKLDGLAELLVELRLQGCADIGLCYPPQTWTTQIALVSAASATLGRPRSLLDLIDGAGDAGAVQDEFLPVDEAFRLTIDTIDPYTLSAYWQIQEGYYLYKEKMAFSAAGDVVQLGAPRLPAGKKIYDEFFGDAEVYYTEVEAVLPLSRAGPAAADFDLTIEYQGCAEDGICYPPVTRSFTVPLPAASSGDRPRDLGPAPSTKVSEQDRLAGLISDSNLLLVLATFYGLGLLLAFTPCVLPMIPILSGIIAGQGPKISTRRSFLLSLAFVLGMAVTYTVAGAAFAAAGQQAQAVFQKPWIIILFSGLFVALALAMFDVFTLQLPASLQTRLADMSNRQKAGTYVGTVVMGALSALVVTACVAPPLVAALAVIGQSGDILRGSSALFALSMGMGTPLLIAGTTAGTLLPKAGPWMDGIKAAFGIMLLGVAIWMLERIVPGPVALAMWAALVFLSGVAMGALVPLGEAATGWRRFSKGLGLLFMAYAIMMLVGAASGSRDPFQPLTATVSGSATVPAAQLEFERIKSVSDLEISVKRANLAGKSVMLDFYADWCVSCKEMEKYTFTDPRVADTLADTVLLQADVTANDDTDQALLKHMGIYGPPTIAFFGLDGLERKAYRVVGFMPAENFHLHASEAFMAPAE